MNCRDFQHAWDRRLDRVEPGEADPDAAAMEAHAAACADCRALASGYQALWQALRSRPLSPAVPAGFADRVLVAMAEESSRGWSLPLRRVVPLAAAAAVLVAAWLGFSGRPRPTGPSQPPVVADRAIDPADLTEALADVGVASLALAWEASAPAARVGSEVLQETGLPEARTALSLPTPGMPSGESTLLQDVGEGVNAGVRPLAGSARSAFGFLVGVAPPKG